MYEKTTFIYPYKSKLWQDGSLEEEISKPHNKII